MAKTVTRALVELKTIDNRINKARQNLSLARLEVDKKVINGDDWIDPTAQLQSINDMIQNRATLKMQIMVSNMNTNVTIGNKTMTVLQAIEEKASISYKHSLLRQMKIDYRNAEDSVNTANSKMQDNLQNILTAAAGTGKLSAEDSKAIAEPYITSNEAKMVSGTLKLKDAIMELDLEIDTFSSEVDLVLSESNALTELV